MSYATRTIDILLGYYPEFRYELIRKAVAATGLGVALAAAINNDYKFALLGSTIYCASRFFPLLRGYRGHWRR